MAAIINDHKYAFRQLRNNTVFTSNVVLTLALGIGANTTTFNIVNTTFFRKMPSEPCIFSTVVSSMTKKRSLMN